ncbi:DUF3793 family protein [Lachnospiraceae bacterium KGMB03038]|nr:DUF3793 family protein [Lachnospiraceae bacterium KGMB03038]
MPVEVISYMMAERNASRRLQFQLALQCGPFLKGMKKGSITNIERQDLKELWKILAGTGIAFRVLAAHKGKYLILFYRRREMEEHLNRPDILEFLEGYDYKSGRFEELLAHLALRVRQHSCEGIGFPHEIGVFLDYPLEDVTSFIQMGGKHSLLTGYWKVYHNPEQARMTFLAYDKARYSAVNEFLAGRTIQDIAGRTA